MKTKAGQEETSGVEHEDDRHAIVFGYPAYPQTGADSTAPIRDALQGLLDRTVLADPAPWQGWLREEFARATGVPDPVPPRARPIHNGREASRKAAAR